MNRVLPILYNGGMVRAILEDRKTVTRRKIDIDTANQFDVEHGGKSVVAYINQETGDSYDPKEICRYQPGDILYVRETWAFIPCIDCMQDDDGKCLCNEKPVTHEDKHSVSEGCFVYRADCLEEDKGCLIWSPSIHMPRQAARIWLKVTDVRAEHLHSMTLDGFLAEGVTVRPEAFNDPENAYWQAKGEFTAIWNGTIRQTDCGKYGWDVNPWVWVIEFERCGKPEPCILRGIEPAEDKRPCIGYGDAWADESCEMCKGCTLCSGNM